MTKPIFKCEKVVKKQNSEDICQTGKETTKDDTSTAKFF